MKDRKKGMGTKGAATLPRRRPLPQGMPVTDPSRPGPVRPDEMTPEVMEFLHAIDDYRAKSGRPFPSWSEVLAILGGLGYRKLGPGSQL